MGLLNAPCMLAYPAHLRRPMLLVATAAQCQNAYLCQPMSSAAPSSPTLLMLARSPHDADWHLQWLLAGQEDGNSFSADAGPVLDALLFSATSEESGEAMAAALLASMQQTRAQSSVASTLPHKGQDVGSRVHR